MTGEALVFTIGHSTHTQDRFIDLLATHRITAVCDVRSAPYSRVNPQFNRDPLQHALKTAGIAYRFLGQELGARSLLGPLVPLPRDARFPSSWSGRRIPIRSLSD